MQQRLVVDIDAKYMNFVIDLLSNLKKKYYQGYFYRTSLYKTYAKKYRST